jgi:hypothetical protein
VIRRIEVVVETSVIDIDRWLQHVRRKSNFSSFVIAAWSGGKKDNGEIW